MFDRIGVRNVRELAERILQLNEADKAKVISLIDYLESLNDGITSPDCPPDQKQVSAVPAADAIISE